MQSVDGIICDADGVIHVLAGNKAQYGPEYFLLCDSRAVVYIDEQSRLEKVSAAQIRWPRASGGQRCAAYFAIFNVLLDSLELTLGGKRSHLRVGRIGIPHSDGAHFVGNRPRQRI